MTKKRAAIFVSGSGTNMENLARRAQTGEINCDIGLIVCDNAGAFALKRAERLGLETFLIDRKKFSSKNEFESAISDRLKEKKIDVIFLAGYMRILGAEFVRTWYGKILNIHPSLLPKYPGAHSIKDAFEAKEKVSGVTVHFVDEGVDSGPIILQRKVPIKPKDTLETFEERIHAAEYEIYPDAIQLYLTDRLKISGRKVEVIKDERTR